ncbi:hypothetical protein AXJ14_gp180 [Geobacillus virus E3]|uniref:hypothetical protein n=1 Tax=Geobacillus virus E3 TaxID=1572712 RepID=UPI00067187B5|nr:hypothetical protein AXJ14_gp180 [Geobacillus virus E3]AJA41499.1 hypothetical protein E3_0180 [Geobacillus virus E3]
MRIKKGTKAIVLGSNRVLRVAFDQDVKIGDYIELNDGCEYVLKDFDYDEIIVTP